MIPFEEGQKIAEEVIDKLQLHFSKVLICGSIRRQKRFVNDIDIVAIPSTKYPFGAPTLSQDIIKLDPQGPQDAKSMGKSGAGRFLDGPKIKRFNFKGVAIDLYLANENTFSCLVLIRTGSANHNVKLTTEAIRQGMKLFANGEGLCKVDSLGEIIEKIATTEEDILKTLLKRVPIPSEREI